MLVRSRMLGQRQKNARTAGQLAGREGKGTKQGCAPAAGQKNARKWREWGAGKEREMERKRGMRKKRSCLKIKREQDMLVNACKRSTEQIPGQYRPVPNTEKVGKVLRVYFSW